MRRWSILIAAAAIVATAACSGGGTNDTESSAAEGEAASDAEFADETGASHDEAVAGGAGAGASTGASDAVPDDAVPDDAVAPRVVKTAEMRVEVEDGRLRKAFERAAATAGAFGGFVVDSTLSLDAEDEEAASLVLRVPAERFDAALAELASLGEVDHEQLSGEDVTARIVDLEARLANLRAQEEALRVLMAKATTVGETIEVQRQLFAVREQAEQLAAQHERLADTAAFATVRVTLVEGGAAAAGSDGIADAFRAAVDGAVAVVGALLVATGYALPLAALAGLVWAAYRGAAALRRDDRRAGVET